MFKIIATYKTHNDSFTSESGETYETLRDAQLGIEDMWEMDLEGSDIWIEELTPDERDERFPVKVNDYHFRCTKNPAYDVIEYRIVEEKEQ